MFKPYEGTLDRKKMPREVRRAYEAFCGLKARSKRAGLPAPTFGAREFMGWWFLNLKSFTGIRPTCGRRDHSLGYSFNNIEMQAMADNSAEMNARTKAPARERAKGNKVQAIDKSTGAIVHNFNSIRETAKHFGVSQRLIQFMVRGEYKNSYAVPFDLRSAA